MDKKGNGKKLVSLTHSTINVIDEKGKARQTKIKTVVETTANRFFARQNILVKGAIVETDLGKVKITNRPSQEGTINAVLLKK
jgi:small subunit ribosomal protein S8e